MPSLLMLLLADLLASFATTTSSNIDTALQLGPR